MEKVKLGSTGILVSEFIYGAGSIGGVGSSSATRGSGNTPEEGMQRLDEALELGINMVDTADAYGGGVSEKTVGRWIRERQPTDFVVSTKVGMIAKPDGSRGVDLSREHIDRQLAQSLDTLGTVDLYIAHATDPVTPLEETLQAFSDAQESGRIKCWGLSNVPAERIRHVLDTADRLRLHRPASIENRFNLLDRKDEAEVLPLVASEGLAYTPFSPLAGGVLSARYLDGAAPEPSSRIAVAGELYYKGFYTPENLEKVARLREVADEMSVSVSGLALAWLRDHEHTTAPIVAPRTKAHWDAVIQADAIRLDTVTLRRISAIFD
jgi:aryl-alcohol dehydrogenase-like predicted oxidoreductase